MTRLVSVVIVTYNNSDTIAETLDSVFNQRTPQFDIEILVVDGGSTDGTLAVVDEYPVDIYQVPNGSIGKCRNIGIEKASGDYIAFIDSDCRAPPTWLQQHLETLEQYSPPIIGVGGPNIAFRTDPVFSRVVESFGKTMLGSGGSPQSYGINETTVVKSVPACNVLYDPQVFEHFRFDNNINIGEDAEFHYRLSHSDFKLLFDPSTKVEHHLPSNTVEFFGKNHSYGKAMAQIQMKHRSIIRWYSFLPTSAFFIFVLSVVLNKKYFIIKLYVSLFLLSAIYGMYAVYRDGHTLHALLVLLLLPIQYISYALGFLHGLIKKPI
jgi:succinoglycan biosynthesis protein ExoA